MQSLVRQSVARAEWMRLILLRGLAVMGENLILNFESRGFTVACFNRTVSKVDAFVKGRAAGESGLAGTRIAKAFH